MPVLKMVIGAARKSNIPANLNSNKLSARSNIIRASQNKFSRVAIRYGVYSTPTHVYCRGTANSDTIKALTLNLNSVNCTDPPTAIAAFVRYVLAI